MDEIVRKCERVGENEIVSDGFYKITSTEFVMYDRRNVIYVKIVW